MLATHYLLGLCADLHEKLSGFYFSAADQVVSKAEELEELLSRSSLHPPTFSQAVVALSLPTALWQDPLFVLLPILAPAFKLEEYYTTTAFAIGTSSGPICYNCRRPGHGAAKCPNTEKFDGGC